MKTPRFTDTHRVGKYQTATESTDPNYLRKKFARIRRDQRQGTPTGNQQAPRAVTAKIVLVK